MTHQSFGRWRRSFGSMHALLLELVRTSPNQAAGALVWMMLLTISEGAGLLLLAPLLELVGVVEESPLPRAGGWLSSGLAALGIEATLGSVLLLFVGIAALRTLAYRLQSRQAAAMRENLTATFRTRIYHALAAAEWRFLVTRKPAQLMHVMVTETGRVGIAASHLIDLTVAGIVAVVYLALALRLSPQMAMLVLGCGAVLGWIARSSLDRARALGVRAAKQRVTLHGAIAEHVGALKSAKSYAAADRHEARIASLADDSRRLTLEVIASDADLHGMLELGSTILLAFIVYASAVYLDQPSALMLVMLFIFARLMPRLVAVYRHSQALAANLPVFEAVRALEDECLAAAEAPAVRPRAIAFNANLRFERVSFSYFGRDSAAVSNLNMEIAAGTTTAIVGASGSGKSTVADLLLGLLVPTAGRILVDGEPLSADSVSAWRAQIGYVSQDTFLFDDTIRANLLWARPEASANDLLEALQLAAAEDFVAALPQGLDTIIGDRGVLISGGERQRLSIARALLRRPRVLILDEATSSLDRENELRIQQAIDRLHHRMTIVVITHRLQTIRDADVIHVLESGTLIKSGTWDSLGLSAPAVAATD